MYDIFRQAEGYGGNCFYFLTSKWCSQLAIPEFFKGLVCTQSLMHKIRTLNKLLLQDHPNRKLIQTWLIEGAMKPSFHSGHFTRITNGKHTQTNLRKEESKEGEEDKALACLISENLANKWSGIDQSKRSKFSCILLWFELLGTTLWLICKPHRRTTWAGVLPNSRAMVFTIECSRTFLLPKGAYPWNDIYITTIHQ